MHVKKGFVKPARLPRGAYTPKPLTEVLGPYMAKATQKTFLIQKKADDRTADGKKALRLSIGSVGNRAYIVYRGELSAVRELLAAAYRSMAAMSSEPEISPDKKV